MSGLDLLLDETGQAALIQSLAAATFMLGVMCLYWGFVVRPKVSRRNRALRQCREDLLADLQTAPRRGLAEQGIGLSKALVRRLKLLGSEPARIAQLRLTQAGLRSRDAVAVFLALKMLMPLALGGTALFLLYGTTLYPMAEVMRLAVATIAVLIGYYAPELYVRNATDKRKAELTRALPDAVDLMVICTESGLNLDAALARAAREMRRAQPLMADELELTSIELGFLPDRALAFQNFYERTGLPAIRAMVSTLAQAEKYGTPLAQSLRVLAAEMRDERLLRAEEKAARLPATLTVPMIIFILPALFVVLIGPAILRTIDAMIGLGY